MISLSVVSLTGAVQVAEADEVPVIDNPYQVVPEGPVWLDLSPEAVALRKRAPAEPDPVAFGDLDKYAWDGEPEIDAAEFDARPGLPPGWVQIGDEVVPEAVAAGAQVRARALPDSLRADGGDGPQSALVDDICAFPDAVPLGVYTGDWTPGAEYPRRGTIYLNFVGATLYNGNGENSAENYSVLAITGHDFPKFGGGEDKAIAVAQAVQADFDDWAIRTVYLERPHKTIPYVMTMVGGSYKDTLSGPAGGVAPSADCEDFGMRNVCYSFTNSQGVTTQSNIIGQEIGHTYGLGHTYGKDRIMAYGYATSGAQDMIFGDDCTKIYVAPDQGGACGGVNKCHCGIDDQQNDRTTISAIYAPPGPDIVDPTIEITTPEDGATFESGVDINVDVDVWDDFGGYGWKMMVYEGDELLGEKYDYFRSRNFGISGLPDGTYEVVVEIEDQADHIVQDRITIHVGEEAQTTGGEATGGETTDGTGSGAGDSTGADAASDSDASDAGTSGPGMDDEEGCSCRSAGSPVHAPGALALGIFALALTGRRRT